MAFWNWLESACVCHRSGEREEDRLTWSPSVRRSISVTESSSSFNWIVCTSCVRRLAKVRSWLVELRTELRRVLRLLDRLEGPPARAGPAPAPNCP